MIAYDLDGTICEESENILDNIFYNKFTGNLWSRFRRRNIGVLFRPEGDFIIITARPRGDFKLTKNWLADNNIQPKYVIHIDTPTKYKKEIAVWKSRICIENNVEIYVENDLVIAALMTTLGVVVKQTIEL